MIIWFRRCPSISRRYIVLRNMPAPIARNGFVTINHSNKISPLREMHHPNTRSLHIANPFHSVHSPYVSIYFMRVIPMMCPPSPSGVRLLFFDTLSSRRIPYWQRYLVRRAMDESVPFLRRSCWDPFLQFASIRFGFPHPFPSSVTPYFPYAISGAFPLGFNYSLSLASHFT